MDTLPRDRLRVLIVDDQRNWREALADMLDSDVYEIETAGSYEEAKRKLRQHAFDVLVADQRLVDADVFNVQGILLLDEINELQLGTQAIIVTGYPTIEAVKTALRGRNAFDYILKVPEGGGPFDIGYFRQAVREAARIAMVARAKATTLDSESILGFLKRAGLQVTQVEETPIYRCQTASSALRRLLPKVIYAQFLSGEPLDGSLVLSIRSEIHQLDPQATIVLVFTDRRPTDEGWAQIGTLRIGQFIMLPFEHLLVNTALATGRESAILRTEIEKRLGTDYDPYDIRDPVAGAFSFFGRDVLIEDLSRRISEGRPAGIFGLRKMGKSSLLQALRDRVAFPVAIVNMQTVGHEMLTVLYARILRYWTQWVRGRITLEAVLPTLISDKPSGSFVTAALALLERLEEHQDSPRLAVCRRGNSGGLLPTILHKTCQ